MLFISIYSYSQTQSTSYMAYPYCNNGTLIFHQMQYKNGRFLDLGYFSDTTFISYSQPVGAVAGYCMINADSSILYSEHIDTVGIGQTGTFTGIYNAVIAFYNNATGYSRITVNGSTLDWDASIGLTPIKSGKKGTVVVNNTALTAGQIRIVYYTYP